MTGVPTATLKGALWNAQCYCSLCISLRPVEESQVPIIDCLHLLCVGFHPQETATRPR